MKPSPPLVWLGDEEHRFRSDGSSEQVYHLPDGTTRKITRLPDDPALHRTPEQERTAAIWDDKDVRYVPPAGGMSDATVNPYRRRQQLRINSDRQL